MRIQLFSQYSILQKVIKGYNLSISSFSTKNRQNLPYYHKNILEKYAYYAQLFLDDIRKLTY